jgi:hypothetical protein
MTATAVGSGKLEIGAVFNETFGAIKRNAVSFALMGFLFVALPGLLFGLPALGNPAEEEANRLGGAVSSLAGIVVQGAVFFTMAQNSRGATTTIRDCLRAGARHFLPLLLMTILFGLGMLAGLILLVVPGIILACGWTAAGPALVAEGTGIMGSFRRSWALTRGNRWGVFFVSLVGWIAVIGVTILAGAILGVMGLITETPTAAGVLVEALFSAAAVVVMSALAGAVYIELRRVREGLGGEVLSDIFS